MTQQTYFVIGGHCPRSKLHIQTIINYFLENGLKPVKKINKADIICIYTCGGFNHTQQASIQTIHTILKKKTKNAHVIVTGCLTKINPESMSNFNDIQVIKLDDLEQLDNIIHSKISFKQIPNAGIIGRIPPLSTNDRLKNLYTNPYIFSIILDYLNNLKKTFFKKIKKLEVKNIYHIRISQGCLGNCSYCSIKLAHGRLQSRPIKQIQKDFEIGLKKGYYIFKLIGGDIGAYGIDIKTNIVEILKIFFNLPGNNKIIITDFNPQWLIKYSDELEPLFLANHEKILNLTIPIQSGSNNVLTHMRRYYKIEDVKRYISTLKEKIPTLKIFTHIMVGFPGETDEDFQHTLTLLKEMQFSSVSIYPYSDRSMTEAFKMEGKIPIEVIAKRLKQIKIRYVATD